MSSLLRTVAVAVASSATTALLFVACTVEQPGPARSPEPSAAPAQPSAGSGPSPRTVAAHAAARGGAQPGAAAPNPAASVYQQNGASVVNITSLAVVRTPRGRAEQPQGIGSGFILDADGRIATNNHVVQDADQLTVTFQDKTTVPAQLVGRDPDNDLAVIQVDPSATDDNGAAIRDRVKPVQLGDSDQVVIGETAIAIGSPLGLQQTVTEGIVSALRGGGEPSAAPQGELDLLGGAIQTDASINPGNSGGPLFNAAGEVIGVNSAILSQSGGNEGIGFAIPVNVVKRVTAELVQSGRYRHPLLGVSALPLAQIGQSGRQQLGLAPNQKGLLVTEVSAGAQQAGIRAGSRRLTLGGDQLLAGGDVIVAIDGQPVSSQGELRAYIENNKHPGDSVTVTVLRDGRRLDLPVTLSERPAQQSQGGR